MQHIPQFIPNVNRARVALIDAEHYLADATAAHRTTGPNDWSYDAVCRHLSIAKSELPAAAAGFEGALMAATVAAAKLPHVTEFNYSDPYGPDRAALRRARAALDAAEVAGIFAGSATHEKIEARVAYIVARERLQRYRRARRGEFSPGAKLHKPDPDAPRPRRRRSRRR
jgi:hypothetical protein